MISIKLILQSHLLLYE